MSLSPPIRRLSTASSQSKRSEELINAYEAEEEKIINLLSRKLEKLREEKIDLENTLEAESESQVNRLYREITALRAVSHTNGNGTDSEVHSPVNGKGSMTSAGGPSMEVVLEALRRENEQLRGRLTDTERDYIRMKRMNEIYREELIEHRRRLGLPVDNLIGMPTVDSHPIHRRSWSNASSSSSLLHLFPQAQVTRLTNGVPIPPSAQTHRPANQPSESSTPQSNSPSSSESPFPLSPVPASLTSVNTQLTTPSSSYNPGAARVAPSTLTYPMVPPPSLSSSFGSPTAFHAPRRDHSSSPISSFSRQNMNRRGSFERSSFGERRMSESGGGRVQNHRSSESVERGARVAETGSLIRGRQTGPALAPGPPSPETRLDGSESVLGHVDLNV